MKPWGHVWRQSRYSKLALLPCKLHRHELQTENSAHIKATTAHTPTFIEIKNIWIHNGAYSVLHILHCYILTCAHTHIHTRRHDIQKRTEWSPEYQLQHYLQLHTTGNTIQYIHDLWVKSKAAPRNRLWRPIGLWDAEDPTVYAPAALYSPQTWYFCWRLSEPQSLMQQEGLFKFKTFIHFIGSRIPYIPAFSIVPQPSRLVYTYTFRVFLKLYKLQILSVTTPIIAL
jgi:hypothetical protein